MKNRARSLKVLLGIVAAILSLVSAASVVSASTVPVVWRPSGSGSFLLDISYTGATGGSLYFYDTNPQGLIESGPNLLISDGSFSSCTVSFLQLTNLTWQATGTSGLNLNIGDTNDFALAFNDNSFAYRIDTLLPGPNAYLLTDGATQFQVAGFGLTKSNPVPIPASAAILVAGLLSLVGIGTRRNKM